MDPLQKHLEVVIQWRIDRHKATLASLEGHKSFCRDDGAETSQTSLIENCKCLVIRNNRQDMRHESFGICGVRIN